MTSINAGTTWGSRWPTFEGGNRVCRSCHQQRIVLASLVFVGVELHRATAQSRLSNLRETIAGMNSLRAVTDDPRMADTILRGRQGLDNLTETEVLSFDRYLRRTVTQLRAFSKSAGYTIEGRSFANVTRATLREEIDTPGGREWWARTKPLGVVASEMAELIDEALK